MPLLSLVPCHERIPGMSRDERKAMELVRVQIETQVLNRASGMEMVAYLGQAGWRSRRSLGNHELCQSHRAVRRRLALDRAQVLSHLRFALHCLARKLCAH